MNTSKPNSAFRYAPIIALAAGLAWQYRKDKFIVFGAVCVAFTFGAMIARSDAPEWIFTSLMIASGLCAAISMAFAVRELLLFLANKRDAREGES